MHAPKIYNCIFLLVLSQLFCITVKAQSARPYYVEHFGEEEGLTQNSINSILPDQHDFLWIATEGGITRFNGNRFLSVAGTENIKNINFTRIKDLYLKGKDTIIAYSGSNNQVALIVNNKIVALEEMQYRKHGLFFLNMHYPVPAPDYLTNASAKTSAITKDWNVSSGGVIGALYNKDTFLVRTNSGISVYDSRGLVKEIKLIKPVSSAILFMQQQILYLDEENYINYYSLPGFKKRELLPITSKRKPAIFRNDFGNNFFCVADSTLYLVDVTSGKIEVKKILNNLHNAADITTIYQKDSNVIVIGTLRNGLYVYKKQYFQITDPLPDEESDAFYGQVLFSDNETILAGKNNLFRNGRFLGKTKADVSINNYTSIKDSKGYYWYIFNEYILRARQVGVLPDTIIRLKGYPRLLLEDRQGNIWVNTNEQFGYILNGKFTALTFGNLNYHSISCMRQNAAGNYLLGTRNGLFSLKNIHDPVLEPVAGFGKLDIRFILSEANGQTWICTYGRGFYLVTAKEIIAFPENNGRLTYVHCVIEDAKGYFWLPTNNGLFVTSRGALMAYIKNRNEIPFYYQFSKKHGLRSNEFNGGGQPPFLLLPNGDMSIPSMQGLVSFSPAAINFNFSSSPILVDNIYADSTEILQHDEFVIDNNISNIRFSLSSSFWGEKENDLLEYQIVESGKTKAAWLPVDAWGTINLFTPSYGNYSLLVRKRKGLNANDYVYKVVKFKVLPKWYQTKAILLLAALGLILILTAISTWRRRNYRRANRILKSKVDAATVELQQMNNTLEKKVAERTNDIIEAESRFRTLVEDSLVGVYILQDGKFMYVNPRFEEILGYDTGELAGTKALLIISEKQRDIAAEKVRLRMTGELETEQYEIEGLKKDGTTCQLKFFGSRIIYKRKPTFMGTMLDITARKAAEERLIIEKDLSQSIINSLPGVFFIFDEHRIHQLWNKNFETVTGYSSEELKMKLAGTCIAENDLLHFTHAVEKMYNTGSAGVEVTLINKYKKQVPYYVNGIAITYEGRPCILGIGIDISERKKAEEEKEHANYLLNERIKELTTLYRAGLVLQEEDRSILVTLYEFVSILPHGWQYPDITAARVTLGEMEFATTNFRTSPFSQEAHFATSKDNIGKIEIVYLEERPPEVEGPFLAEERKLLDMLADMLKVYLTKREAITALQKSEANLQTIFDTTDTVYALLDEQFRVVAFNQRCAVFSEKEFKIKLQLYSNFIAYFPEGRQEVVVTNMKKVMAGSHINYEISYPQENGKLHWYYIRMYPIMNAQKMPFGLMMSVSDITEKKLLEQRILDQKIQEQKKVIRAILIGEEKERNKIGQELHDNINQILAGIKI